MGVERTTAPRPPGGVRRTAVTPPRPATTPAVRGSVAPSVVTGAVQRAGTPLEPAVRRESEQRLGQDFSRVRIHSDGEATRATAALGARAYTLGRHIVIREGLYNPSTGEGRRLLAHELTHAAQQAAFHDHRLAGAPVVGADHLSEFEARAGTGAVTPLAAPAVQCDRVFDERRRANRAYARSLGKEDAARIQKSGTLSDADRQQVNAALRFFDGAAKEAYIQEIKPTLLQFMPPEKEIEMPVEYVGNLPPAEAAALLRRRKSTQRRFDRVKDDQLEIYYHRVLNRYLDGEEALWDLDTIEQIIRERAPGAPWHEPARQEFLALRRMPWYQKQQLEALDQETQSWTQEERELARNLLIKWLDLRNQGRPAAEVKAHILELVKARYEAWLRAVDRQRMDSFAKNPPGTRATIAMRMAGENPGVSWFADENQPGPLRLRDIERYMRVVTRDDVVPKDAVFLWAREYRKRTNPEILGLAVYTQQAASIAGLGGLGSRTRPAPAPAPPPVPTAVRPPAPSTPPVPARPVSPPRSGAPRAGQPGNTGPAPAPSRSAPVDAAAPAQPTSSFFKRYFRDRVLAAMMRGTEISGTAPRVSSGGTPPAVVARATPDVTTAARPPAPTPTPAPAPVSTQRPVQRPTAQSPAQATVPSSTPAAPAPQQTPAGPATVVQVSQQEYEARLAFVTPEQYDNLVLNAVERAGHQAAIVLTNASLPDGARFIQACQNGNWTLAGTLFHAEAARQIRLIAASLTGVRITAEDTIQSGRGGSRLDIVAVDAQGRHYVIDWKTTGRSGLRSIAQMQRHAAQYLTNRGAALDLQISKSWVDFVRSLIPNVDWPD